MAKFMSKYGSHVICYKPVKDGIKQSNVPLKFHNGMFETTDKDEIAAIRKSSVFGVSVTELKTVDLKPEFKKEKEGKEENI